MFGCAIYTTDQHCSHVIHSFETHPKQRQEPDYCSQVFCWRSCACVLRASASVPYEHAPDDATSTDQYDFTGTNPPIISVMMANIMEHLASTEYTVSWKSIFMDWLYMITKNVVLLCIWTKGWLDWICLTTTHVLHTSRPTQVNVSQSCFHSLNNNSSLIILYTSGGSWS